MQWILASASPRRKELLKEIIPDFSVIPAKGEEKADETLSPLELVQTLAFQKAAEVAKSEVATGKAVIGSDTVVALGGEILGKPKDKADAVRMLKRLSGVAHEVYTGVCILLPEEDGERSEILAADCTKVLFHELSDKFIQEYVDGGSPMDKAGAYGIQDGGLVKEIKGSYSNVVGFPVELFKRLIENL